MSESQALNKFVRKKLVSTDLTLELSNNLKEIIREALVFGAELDSYLKFFVSLFYI